VLTLAAAAHILQEGGAAEYAALGMGRSRGTMPVQLGGNIRHGGLVEVPFGITLAELIADIGGGTASGRPVKAAQVGGPLGAYIPPSQFHLPLDYEAFAAADALVGHAGVVVFDDTADMGALARFAMQFCAVESCGKCTPCRIGSTRGVELIDRIRAVRPDIALTSDFIVGFPGESDADFEATLQLVRDIGYATAFSFKYSKRPGTPASTMRKQIAEDVKTARLDALQKLLLSQQYAFDDSQIGKILPALFEKSARESGQVMGRTPYQQPVHVIAPTSLIGTIADVKIERRTANSLHGSLA
jgi:hypothetical protein